MPWVKPSTSAGLGARAAEHLVDRGDHAAGLVLGRARDLGGVEALAVEQGGVGEGPADVDAEQHRREATRLRHKAGLQAAAPHKSLRASPSAPKWAAW